MRKEKIKVTEISEENHSKLKKLAKENKTSIYKLLDKILKDNIIN